MSAETPGTTRAICCHSHCARKSKCRFAQTPWASATARLRWRRNAALGTITCLRRERVARRGGVQTLQQRCAQPLESVGEVDVQHGGMDGPVYAPC